MTREYRSGDYFLMEYNPGVSTDAPLLLLYNKFFEQGILPRIFTDVPNITISQFLFRYNKPEFKVQLYVKLSPDGKEMEDVAGYTAITNRWRTGSGNGGGEVEVGFTKDHWDGELAVKLGELFLDYVRDAGGSLLTSTTPSENRAALIYLEKMGFQKVGVIPNGTMFLEKPSDIVYMYREV